MNQQQDQTKQEYAKYDQAAPGYAPPLPDYSQTSPPPQYGQVQPYPNRQYAPYPYRRTRGSILPMLIIAAIIVAVFIIGLATSLFTGGKTYNHDFLVSADTPVTLHINSDSADLRLVSSVSVDNSLDLSAKGVGSFDPSSNGNDFTLNVKAPGGFAIFGFGHAEVDVTMPANTSLDIKSGSGDLTISQSGSAPAGSITAQNGSGNIDISGAQGDLNLQTGSGNIKVSAASPKSNLTLHTGSGDIQYSGSLAANSYAETGSGSINLTLPSNSSFRFDVSTGSGTIDGSAFTMGTQEGDHSLQGSTLNAPTNAPSLKVRSGSGDIKVKALEGR